MERKRWKIEANANPRKMGSDKESRGKNLKRKVQKGRLASSGKRKTRVRRRNNRNDVAKKKLEKKKQDVKEEETTRKGGKEQPSSSKGRWWNGVRMVARRKQRGDGL